MRGLGSVAAHGWVFADRSGEAWSWLDGLVASYDAASLVTCESHVDDVAANWSSWRTTRARGPLAPDEDGVHHFVASMARAYQGSWARSP